jgi:hypothetical protein
MRVHRRDGPAIDEDQRRCPAQGKRRIWAGNAVEFFKLAN